MQQIIRGLATSLVLAGLTVACAPVVKTHGNDWRESNVEKIQIGNSTQGDLYALIGSPSLTSTFDPNVWYYVQRTTIKRNFYQEEVSDQKVLIVTFDDRGIVRELDGLGLEDAQNVSPVTDQTPTAGRKLSILQQMLGNIGRFSGPDG